MPELEEPLDDPGVRSVEEERTPLPIELQPKVAAQRRRGARSDGEAHVFVASFEAADHVAMDADGARDGRLRDARPQTQLPKVVAEAARGPAQLSVAGVQRLASDGHREREPRGAYPRHVARLRGRLRRRTARLSRGRA